MGATAIWSMHFIGNRAIVLDGDIQMQIAYNSGSTALSFFVPIVVLLAAFLAIGTNDIVSKVRVVIGGTLAGLAICGMHYLGQAGIANYACVYSIPHVVGASVIAVIASITALWKRGLCAIVLAGAVSGMHWLASVGTRYRFRGATSLKQNISRDQTVIIVIALVCSCGKSPKLRCKADESKVPRVLRYSTGIRDLGQPSPLNGSE